MATIALSAAFSAIASASAGTALATGTALAASGSFVGLGLGAATAVSGSIAAASSAAAWGAIGSIAGAYIDSAFILPRLFKSPESGEAKGIGITGLDEGDPHNHAIGPYNRIPGFLYYAPIKPRYVKGESGGKGGGSGKAGSPDKYYTDGVFALTRTGIDTNVEPFSSYPAGTEVNLLWLDGKVRLIGGDQLRASSADYEIYESIEKRSGYVSLIYTIQSKSPETEIPAGESFVEWSLANKFRQGLEFSVVNSLICDFGFTLFGGRDLGNGVESDTPLNLVGSGVLPEGSGGEPAGRHYVQIEWEYWKDNFIFRPASTDTVPDTPRYFNNDFYQGLAVTPASNTYNNPRVNFPSGRVTWSVFTEGLWDTPLGTTSVPGSNGTIQVRAYREDVSDGSGPIELKQESEAFDEDLARSIIIRDGESTSEISIIVNEEGPGPTPALTKFSHLVINNLDLTDFGSRLPNAEVLVQQDTDPLTLQEAIYRICCVFHDLTPDLIDVEALRGTPERVYGYWWPTPFGLDILQPLIIAYDLSVLEDSGKIVFRRRIDSPTHDIPKGDLSSVSDGKVEALMIVTEDPSTEKVLTTTVEYTDRDNGYGDGSQLFTRPDLDSGRLNQIDLTRLMLTATEARQIAQRTTWQGSMYEQTVEFIVGPKWGHIRAGDFVTLSDVLDQDWRIMVTAVERGADGRMALSGYRDYGLTEEFPQMDTDDGASPIGQNAFYVPPQMAAEVLDIGPLSLQDFDTPAVYLATAAKFYGADYRGSSYYTSDQTRFSFGIANFGYAYSPYVRADVSGGVLESTMGVLLDPIPEGALDVINYLQEPVRVRLYNGELYNVSNVQETYDRRALLFIDGEVVSFQNAELVEDPEFGYENTYALSGEMLRGLYNTEERSGSHEAGGSVVLIEQTTLSLVGVDTDKVDRVEHRYLAVPAGAQVSEWDSEVDIPATGNPGGLSDNFGSAGRPFPVSNIRTVAVDPGSTLLPWSFFRLAPYAVGDQVRTFDAAAGIQVFRCILEHTPVSLDPVNTYPPEDVTDFNVGTDPDTGLPFGVYWQELPRDRDYLIKWNFRAPVPIPLLPSNTEQIRRTGTTFTLTIFKREANQSLTLVRTVNDIVEQKYTYSHQDMTIDGINPANFRVGVRSDRNYMTSPVTEQDLPAYE
tara:strand:+ start:19420 stop:22878 length:3459 start_codon:yes stop_codon:yes gene_type:complete